MSPYAYYSTASTYRNYCVSGFILDAKHFGCSINVKEYEKIETLIFFAFGLQYPFR